MNRTYRLIWNETIQGFVPAPEFARRRGKRNGASLLAGAALATFALNAYALPTDGQVTSGSGSIATSGTTMTVNQGSQNLSINWATFNIAANEAVRFNQPNSSAIALNRVLGTEGSQILGSLSANGQVFILNPNGVLFGPNARVDVGGIVASTLNLSDADFLAGKYRFSGSGGTVLNRGTINAGSYVALLGGQVSNEGVIVAHLGKVALAAGNKVTLDFAGDGLLRLAVDEGALNALVENKGLIKADGGEVLLTARSAEALLKSVVNNEGVIEAHTVENKNGAIKLLGDMDNGTVKVGGTLDASAPDGGDGGFIETSAAHVKVADDAKITTAAPNGKTGTWLIDPQDYTIVADGSGDITGIVLSNNLASSNVTILSTGGGTAGNGDIFVNDAVSWNANTLTLNAYRNIYINRDLTGSALALEYGQGAVAAGNTANYYVQWNTRVNLAAGANFSTRLGSDGTPVTYTVLTGLGAAGSATGTDLQGISGNLAGNYALGADIDATATAGWNAGAGFQPLGDTATPFTGNFAGLGHVISSLAVNRPTTDYVGLFGRASVGTLRDVGLAGGSITGQTNVGALAGRAASNNVNHAWSSASVTATGDNAGGLVGYVTGSFIDNSYATGNVMGVFGVGGLVGSNGGDLSKVYATGNVTATGDAAGGLVGSNGGPISDAYAILGSVTGNDYVGGLVGSNAGSVNRAYAAGSVSGAGANVGGLVGGGLGNVNSGFWDIGTTGQATSAGGTGLTTAQSFGGSADYTGFDFASTWWMRAGHTRPLLRMERSTVVASANQLQLMDADLGADYLLVADIDLGATLSNPGGLWSTSRGFAPIGMGDTVIGGPVNSFTGGFDGQGYTISNLFINVGNASLYAGLFGIAKGADIRNVGLAGGSVARIAAASTGFAGGLVGWNGGTVTNAWSSASVTGTGYASVGGLAGGGPGTLANSYYDVDAVFINGGHYVTPGGLYTAQYQDWYNNGKSLNIANYASTLAPNGGYYEISSLQGLKDLLGFADNAAYKFRLTANLDLAGAPGLYVPSFSAAEFDGANRVISNLALGQALAYNSYLGLFGRVGLSDILNLGIANASVTGNSYLGALAGYNEGVITASWASGTVTGSGAGDGYVGGLVGYNAASGIVNNSYATVAVAGADRVGGLVGVNDAGAILSSYAAGSVTATGVGGVAGGLVGTAINGAIANDSFWDTQTTGLAASAGGTGLTTADMMSSAAFTGGGWNISTVGGSASLWRIYPGYTYPLLRGFLTPLTVTAVSGSRAYDGTLDGLGVTYSTAPNANLFGTVTASVGNKNVGTWAVAPSTNGLYSNQLGYDVEYVAGSLAITARALALNGLSADNKVYDGNTTATINSYGSLSGVLGGETVNLDSSASSANFLDKDAGTGIKVAVTGLLLNGADAGNYSIGSQATTADITPRALTLALTGAVDKTYDGNTAATLTQANYNVGNVAGGDSILVTQFAGNYDTPNIGTGKTVNVNVAAGDYAAGGGTLLSNYQLVTGNFSGPVGRIAAVSSGGSAGGASSDAYIITFDPEHRSAQPVGITDDLSPPTVIGGGMKLPDGVPIVHIEGNDWLSGG